jgi:tetratricopeptide (TPR) repeat protein
MEGMAPVELSMLSLGEATKLLITLCPRIDEHAITLAQICGRLPLALRIAGGYLRNHRIVMVEDYLKGLANEKNRLAKLSNKHDAEFNVAASLELSYQALSENEQATLQRLGVFAGSFTHEAAEAVTMLPGELLERLDEHCLLEYDIETDRIVLHDLVRLFALERLGNTFVKTRDRHAEYYLSIAERSKQLFLVGGGAVLDGLRLLDAEKAQIDGVWRWLRARPPTIITDEFINDLAEATAFIGLAYDTVGDYTRAMEHHQRQVSIINRFSSYYRRHTVAPGYIGGSFMNREKYLHPLVYHQRLLAIASDRGDHHDEITALRNIGHVYHSIGEYKQAISFYRQSLVLVNGSGDTNEEAIALSNIGTAYYSYNKYQHAITYYHRSLAIYRALHNLHGEANICWNIGLIYEELGDLVRAFEMMQARIDLLRAIGYHTIEQYNAYVDKLQQRIIIRQGQGSA